MNKTQRRILFHAAAHPIYFEKMDGLSGNEAVLQVGGEKIFSMQVKNNISINKYIQRITWNEKSYIRSYLLHKDVVKCGRMVIELGSKPSDA